MDSLFLRSAITVALFALAGVLAGAAIDPVVGWALFSCGLLAQLAFHVRHVNLLLRWLRQPTLGKAPPGRGTWDYIFSLLQRHERMRAQQYQQVARTLARFREAGRAHPDGVVILDENHRIEWCNDMAESQFDVHHATDHGQPVTNLIRQPQFVTYLEGGDYSQPLELRSSRWGATVLSVQIVPYGDAQKLLLSRDITRLERLETMRRDFIANVSHELRTPLTILSGFLETIRELDLDPARTRDYLALMATQSERMHHIVDDLLTLSTLESAAEPALDERVRIVPLLERLRAEAEALSGGKHRIIVDAGPNCDLLGSEKEITSAFGNLVTNAVRYTPAGGEVRLVWRADGGNAEFTVEDTGIGIAPEHIPRLTERFYRVDRGRSRETGGTGLGLAIVKHILNRHHATLDITSEPGKGSRFAARFSGRRVVPALPAAEDAEKDLQNRSRAGRQD